MPNPYRIVACSGGGLNTLSNLAGMAAGCADVMRTKGREVSVSKIFEDYSLMSGNSGGTWFLTGVGYSKKFRNELVSEADLFNTTGYGGRAKTALSQYNGYTTKILSLLPQMGGKNRENAIFAAQCLAAGNDWAELTRSVVFDTMLEGSKLDGSIGSTPFYFEDTDMVIAMGGLKGSTYDTNGKRRDSTSASEGANIVPGIWRQMPSSVQPLPDQPEHITSGFAALPQAGVDKQRKDIYNTSNIIPISSKVSSRGASWNMYSAYPNESITLQTEYDTLSIHENSFHNQHSSNGSFFFDAGLLGPTIASSSAAAFAAINYANGGTIQKVNDLLGMNIDFAGLAPLGALKTFDGRTVLGIADTKGGDGLIDLTPFLDGPGSFQPKGPSPEDRWISQEAYTRLADVNDKGLFRFADGGYLDNTSVAFGLGEAMRSNEIEEGPDGFVIDQFLNNTDLAASLIDLEFPNVNKTVKISSDFAALFGIRPEDASAPHPENVKHEESGLWTMNPQIFETTDITQSNLSDSKIWRSPPRPRGRGRHNSPWGFTYFQLDVTTVDNERFGIVGGKKGKINVFFTSNPDSFAMPVDDSTAFEHAAAFNFYRDIVSEAPDWVPFPKGSNALNIQLQRDLLNSNLQLNASDASSHGTIENDNLTGTNMIDTYIGLDGDDLIMSSSGVDYAYGGTGKDHFIVKEADGHMVIRDFNINEDKLYSADGSVLAGVQVNNSMHVYIGSDLVAEIDNLSAMPAQHTFLLADY